MQNLTILLLILSLSACGGTEKATADNSPSESQSTEETVKSMKYEELMETVQKEDDVLYVVNFWATWCAPCVAELPEFLEVNEEQKDNPNFKMYLVSLDMPSKMQDLLDFIQKENINAEVILLDDAKRMNTWIPLFDPTWSGAIPATILYKNSEKKFFIEGTLDKLALENLITKNI